MRLSIVPMVVARRGRSSAPPAPVSIPRTFSPICFLDPVAVLAVAAAISGRVAATCHIHDFDFLECCARRSKAATFPGRPDAGCKCPGGYGERPECGCAGRGSPVSAAGLRGRPIRLELRPTHSSDATVKTSWPDISITLTEAVAGGNTNVPTINGPVTSIPAGSNTGAKLRPAWPRHSTEKWRSRRPVHYAEGDAPEGTGSGIDGFRQGLARSRLRCSGFAGD